MGNREGIKIPHLTAKKEQDMKEYRIWVQIEEFDTEADSTNIISENCSQKTTNIEDIQPAYDELDHEVTSYCF